jgi:hypothetical protein
MRIFRKVGIEMNKKEENLWETVGNECLKKAKELLKVETAPTLETVGAVKQFVNIAIAIDELNLRWAEQNRSFSAEHQGQLLGRP